MQTLDIQPIPAQSISAQLDSSFYELRIYYTDGVMSADISRDGTILQTGARIVSGYPLINYTYLTTGNFVLTTEDEDYPDYNQFGITQFLYFISESEIEALNAGT